MHAQTNGKGWQGRWDSQDAIRAGTKLVDKDGLGIGSSHSIHGIKKKGEVLAGDELLEKPKVVHLLEGCKVVCDRIYDLNLHGIQ